MKRLVGFRRQLAISIFISILLSFQGQSAAQDFSGERSVSSISSNCRALIDNIIRPNYLKRRKSFEKTLTDVYGKNDGEIVRDHLDSLLFVDYIHSADTLLEIKSRRVELLDSDLFMRYADEVDNLAFENHLEGLAYLKRNRPEVNSRTLKELHKRLMRDGIDDIDEDLIGNYRPHSTVGMVYREDNLSEQAVANMRENPYLYLGGLNKRGNSYSGHVEYPNAERLTPYLEEILERQDQALLRDIRQYVNEGQGDVEYLNERLMNVLTEDLLEWFTRQRSEIGSLNNHSNVAKYIDLVAEFQRNLISIHPFADGNGRTVRLFALYYPFMKEQIPPPRILNPDLDIYSSLSEWRNQVARGIEATASLYDEVSRRAKLGLSIDGTPELFTPYIPKRFSIAKRQQRPAKTTKDFKEIEVNKQDYSEYVEQVLNTDAEMMRLYRNDPYEFFTRVEQDYLKFVRGSHLVYVHEKFGQEYVALRFVSDDFIETFGDQSFRDTRTWKWKMDTWYEEDVVWRGLADMDNEVTDREIIEMFTEVDQHFVSNNVMANMRGNMSSEDITRLIVDDFDRYNEDLVSGGLVRMARDHSESGELYGVSYGYSTSKNRTVGKAFAMGAMVVAEYGEHQAQQHLLKSRVLVGMRRAHKDVDLTRLRQVRNDFSYRYGRQQEVMGIGGADPDSVMFVQTIDENGDVIRSFVRNPERPHQIVVVEGEANSWPIDSSLSVLERIDLRN